MKKICVITGTRAEYGLLRPVMRAIQASDKLSLQLIATGMHFRDEFVPGIRKVTLNDRTIRQVERDGFKVDQPVPMLPDDDSSPAMGRAVGQGIIDLTGALRELSPDVVLVLGDRSEVFAAAIAAMFCGCSIAHIHGGDRTRGGFDESMRHAITKLAHVHFAATEESAERIRRMGENPEHVHVVGAPGLDEIMSMSDSFLDELKRDWPITLEPAPIVVLHHPVSTAPENAGSEFREIMNGIEAEANDTGRQVVPILPNNDPGWEAIINEIEKVRPYRKTLQAEFLPSLPHGVFLALMQHAAVLVGNSSSGIIEAPSFGLPVVNVGERQAGRQRAANVIDVPPDREAIAAAVRKALYDKDFRKKVALRENPYGDGHAAERIVRVLEELVIDHELIQKQIAY